MPMNPIRRGSRLRLLSLPLAGALALAVAACSDSTSPAVATRPDSQMHFLRFAASAPPLASTSASFYAVRGQDREVFLWYRPAAGETDSAKFIEFKVPGAALLARPDGSPIAVGDSVLITVSVADTARMIVRFEPSGLRFDPQVTARLKMNFGEADGDYNGDGVVNAEDSSVESQFSMWRQEQPGLPWVKLGSAVVEDLKEVEADITGFSGYAISY